MEANMVRILLLIALFFLLSSDYSSVVKQLAPTFEAGEEEAESDPVDLVSRIKVDSQQLQPQQQHMTSEEQFKRGSTTASGTTKASEETEDAVLVARKKILNAVKNSCLPKLICELNAAPNKENLSQSEVSLLNLLRDTSIMSTAEITSKYHFAAHMGQLISGIEGTGCHNFYPDCPLPGFRVSQLLKNVRFK